MVIRSHRTSRRTRNPKGRSTSKSTPKSPRSPSLKSSAPSLPRRPLERGCLIRYVGKDPHLIDDYGSGEIMQVISIQQGYVCCRLATGLISDWMPTGEVRVI